MSHDYMNGNKAGYQGNGGKVKVTQDCGNGMGKSVETKAPSYGMMPREISHTTGFKDVKGKI